MRITKKVTSIVLAVLMVVSMISVMAVSASALDETDAAVKYTKTNGSVVYGEDFWKCSTTISNGTYEVLKDFTISSRWPTGMFGATATIDLGGHTVTFTNPDTFSMNIRGGNVTVKNGTIIFDTDVANGQGFQVSAGTLTIESSVTLRGTGTTSPVTVFGGTLNTSGKLYAEDSFAIATNGSSSKNYTINVTRGTVSSTNASAIYQCGDGTLNISGGTITGTTGVYVKSGETNITGGTIKGTGAAADYDYNGNGANSTGDALVVDSCGYPGGAPEVNVNGGTFNSTNGDAIASYKKSDDDEFATDTTPAVTDFVKQATISKGGVDADLYDADLYDVNDDGQGNVTVTPKTLTDEVTWEWVESTNANYQYQAKMTVTVGGEEYYTTTVNPTIAVNGDDFDYTATAKYAGVTYTAPVKTVVADGVIKTTNEFNVAVAAGGEWELGNDLNNVPYKTVPNGFKLNGNGHTIYANTSLLNQYYLFTAKDANTKFELSNVTLDGGNKRYGAVCAYQGNSGNNPGNVITLNNVTIQNFKSSTYAGAVYAFGSSTVNLNDCTVIGNQNNTKAQSGVSAEAAAANSGKDIWAGAKATVNINGGTYGEVLLHGGTANATVDGNADVDTVRFGFTNKNEDSTKMKATVNEATVGSFENYTDFVEENVVIDPAKANVTAPEGYMWDDSKEAGMLTLVSLNPLNPIEAETITDGNAFGLDCKYLKGTLLGVQKKDKTSVDAPETSESAQETGKDMRFVAVIDTDLVQDNDVTDYGFVLAKVGTNKTTTNTVFDNLKINMGNGEKTISAVGTKNNVCGVEGYGDPDDTQTPYKYVTCAVNGVDDSSKIVARFYVVKGGKTYYAKYANYNYNYTGCTAGWSDLTD